MTCESVDGAGGPPHELGDFADISPECIIQMTVVMQAPLPGQT